MAALAVHAVGNSLRLGSIDAPSLVLLAWAGVALGVVHVLLCVLTSHAMLTDEVRPPSAQKRRHLALKWVTGALVALAAGVHIAVSKGVLWPGLASSRLLLVTVAAALGVHLWTGVRSLLKDVGLPTSWKQALRAVVALVTLALCLVLLISQGA